MKKILAFVLMAAFLVCPVFASVEPSVEADAAVTTTAATSTTTGATESATTIAAAAAAAAAAATEEVAPVDDHSHVFVIVDYTAPTCVDVGSVTLTCDECGVTYSYQVPATGVHTYVASTKEATCTEEGLITYTCSVCGDTYSEIIPMTEHTPSAEAATCTEAVVCTVCGTELIPATGHSYTYQYDAVIAEDGTYESYGTWVCDDCGDVLEATEGNAIYYYGLLEGTSDESGESEEAETTEIEIQDPNNGTWYTVEIIMVIVLVAELVIIMLSFGKKKKA